jgi:ATP-dependent RNA helicase DeaD
LKDYLKETLDLGRDDVFKVDVKEGFSFFNTDPEHTDKVMEILNNVQLEGRRINVEISKNDGGGRRDHNGRSSGGGFGGRSSGGFRGERSSAPREGGSGGFRSSTPREGGFRSDRNSAPREGGFSRGSAPRREGGFSPRSSDAPRREGGFGPRSSDAPKRESGFTSRAPRRSEGSSDTPRPRRPRKE